MRIVVLSGAGLSAESGLATFRDGDGLWENHRIEDVATPEAFRRDPVLVHRFYNMRRRDCAQAAPNDAHRALARLSQHAGVTLITQNVDDLLERAGARDVVHMHGALSQMTCASCGAVWPAPDVTQATDPCPSCANAATRPDIVWFGEMPYAMDRIWHELEQADLFAAIGTSGQVYPAAGFVEIAKNSGARTVEINLRSTGVSGAFDEHLIGPAAQIVPEWVAGLGLDESRAALSPR